ncbi:Cas9 inhibitor AcrIIA9 family protein [Allofournierella massiliensis]|uniref:PcfK-like protein n=1 Tax=Allofournierella massiliensis TaxID=1650663 RepID=A0A4V2QBB2_9FIRM|nr:Cas9 inhibitor AcrIIA9 family protein [Fournierella massiliensis]TCL55782.1 PcfK-like protein [Fournierella massiliensis]
MGYFSEMSLNMQEGQKSTTEGFPVGNPFEDEETFDELPVPPSDGASTPAPVEPVSASTADVDGGLQEVASGTEEQDETDSIDTQDTDGDDAGQEPETPAEPNAAADEDKRRAEHEAAEAKHKAEWEARQAEKKKAEQEQLDRLAAMSDDEVVNASMQRVSADTEKLTRRNMKECVAEFIQTKCLEDIAFARLTMHPRKSMIHCFQYISRKAWDYIQDELKASGIQPGPGSQGYGCDVPDDLCYQWAEDYFRDPDAKEDQEQEEKFVPKPYYGKSSSKAAKTAKKKQEKKKADPKPKPAADKKPAGDGQLSLLDLGMAKAG